MTYSANLTSLHKGLTPIYPDQDRINFAPSLASDIRILLPDGSYLSFNNIDDNGTIWVCSDIEGWWNLSDPSIPNIERGFGDGSFDVSGRILARDLTFNGSILITESSRTSIAEYSKDARSALLTAFNLVKRGAWLVVDEDEYKRASYVRLNGRPNIDTVNSRGRIDFSIGLRAADPIKYEWIENSTSNLQILDGRYNLASIGGGNPDSMYQSYSDQPYESDPASNSYPQVDWNIGETPANSDGTVVRSYDDYDGGDLVTYYSGDSTNSAGTITVTNHGDSIVYCYLRVIGPFYGPGYIQNITTDQTMNFLPAAAGSTQILGPTETSSEVEYIDIDTRNREIHKGDFTNGTYADSSRELLDPLVNWIYLLPGDNSIYFIDNGVGSRLISPSLEIYWRSGWIG